MKNGHFLVFECDLVGQKSKQSNGRGCIDWCLNTDDDDDDDDGEVDAVDADGDDGDDAFFEQ